MKFLISLLISLWNLFRVPLLFPSCHYKLVSLIFFLVIKMDLWTVLLIRSHVFPLSPTFSSVQWLSHVWHFATPWITASQASLSITNSHSLLKLISIELGMSSSHLILCHLLLLLPPIQTLFFGAPESLQMVIAAMKLKELTPWKESYD